MGKSTGKTLFSIAGAVLGGIYYSALGVGSSIAGSIYGASLMSTIWTATHTGRTSYQFDVSKNEIGMDKMIPIIYGTRKFAGGLESYQSCNSSASSMTKDTIICEGEVTEILGICANTRPIGTQVIFGVSNIAYSDATIKKANGYLTLYANGTTKSIKLQSTSDLSSDLSNENNCSTLKLEQYIEELGNGWRVSLSSGSDLSPSDIKDNSGGSCYKTTIRFSISAETSSSTTIYTGSSSQTPPTNYTTTGSYKNTAWLRNKLVATSTLSFANPNITCVVRGKKVYDTRTSTTIYSENPAMCLRDYLLNKRFGMGRWITSSNLDEDSFQEVADYCDEVITYSDAYGVTVSEPRYTLNLILAESRKHTENIQDFLAVFGGFLVIHGDTISLKIEKQDSTSYAFTENNIKKDSVKFSYTNLTDCPNRYNIVYYDPAQDWTGIKVQVNDTADQYTRGNIINKDVSLAGCTNQGQALRLGKLYRAINRLNGAYLDFSTGTMAMHLQPGDIISFTWRILDGALFRILSISESKGEYSLHCQQYNLSIYDDSLGATISVPNYTTSDNPFTANIPDCTDLSSSQDYYIQKDGTSVSTVTLTWTNPTYTYYYKTYAYYSLDGTNYTSIGNTTAETISLSGAFVGSSYYFKLIVENTAQRYSTGTTIGPIVITGKDANPSDLTNFVVAQANDYYFRFGFTTPTDLDYNHVEIRVGGTSWSSSTLLGSVVYSGAYLSDTEIADGTVSFRAKTVDNGGNYSTNESVYDVTVSGINSYKNIVLERDDVTLKDGTLTNMVFTKNNILVKTDSLEYDDLNTYDDLPSDTYGGGNETDPGYIKYLSPIIDTYKIGKTGINFVFDYGFYDEYPVYDSFADRTYGDYSSDTYDTMTVDTDISIMIRFSNDNSTWTDWQIYLAGDYTFRYIQYYLKATYSSTTMRGYINSLKQYYNVPDITFSETIDVSSSGSSIVFTDYDSSADFYEVPEEIIITVIGSTSLSVSYTNLTATGVTIRLYDTSGNLTSGEVKLICKGY